VSLTRALGRDMMRYFNLTAREPLVALTQPEKGKRS
jgi:hypothetical protein